MREINNDIQKSILKTLLIKKQLRFSDLNQNGVSSDHFAFHISQLLKEGIIEKDGDGFYRFTAKGKEYANRFDIDGIEIKIEKRAKIGVLIVPRDKQGRFLIQQRLKEPFFGYHGFVSGKIKWGEPVYQAAERELLEEAGLKGDLKLKAIEHKIDYSNEGELLEDKFFFIVGAVSLKGELIEKFDCGENKWLLKEEIALLPDLFEDVPNIIKAVEGKEFIFYEQRYDYDRNKY